MTFQLLNLLSALAPLLLLTVLLPLMARSRRGIVFGISLPLEAAASNLVTKAVVRYQRRIILLGVMLLLLVTSLALAHRPQLLPFASIAATLFELAIAIYLRAQGAKQVRGLAAEVPLQRTAELATLSRFAPILTITTAFLPLVGSALWLRDHWGQIPARFPQHWDANGQVNGWGTKTFANLAMPYFVGVGVILLFLAVAAFNAYAPGPELRQRNRITAPLAALAWTIAFTFSVCGLFPLLSTGKAITLVIGSVVATFAVVIWMVCRLLRTTSATKGEPYDGTADIHWHAGGIFYSNPNDPAILVPKRFGMGWTLNYGRPVSWAFTVGLLLFVGAVCVVSLLHH